MNFSEQKPRRGRPPKHPRDNPDTKNALIRSGVEVLTERGYMSSDIEGILKKVGIPKGSFYYYFDSKEAFGYELMTYYANYFAYKLDKYLLDKSLSPLSRIYTFYENTKTSMAKYHFERGCLVGNLGQEIATLPSRYREYLNNILQHWENKMEVCLKEAQACGEISCSANCKQLALFFWIGWEGAVMRAKLVKDEEPLKIFINSFIEGLPR